MRKFGRYEIMHELGRGGMATVYLAHDPAFDRQIAIKVLPAQFTHDPKFRARFLREAKVIATLENPYIVPVYDYGEEEDHPFIVMRYMPGGTLVDRIANGPLKLEEVFPIIRRMAEALDEAHRHSIIHRDLKPSNVLFDTRNEAFLSDFGLAKLSESSTKLTFTGVMVGTPDYMSPEQAVGDLDIDRRSDVYSLGVILYEMLSGHLPYEAGTPMKLLFKHINDPVPELDTQTLGLPPECNAIIASAMAKNRDDRYPSAGMVADVLRSVMAGSGRKVSPPLRLPVSPKKAEAPVTARRPNGAKAAALPPTLRGLSPWLLGAIGVPVMTGVVGLAILWGMYTSGWFEPIPTLIPTLTSSPTSPATATLLPAMLTASAPPPTVTPAPPTPTLVVPPTDTETPPPTDTETPPPTATHTATATRRPPTQRPANTPVPPTATSPPPAQTQPPTPTSPPANTEPPPPPPPPTEPPTNTPVPPPP
jgi:serine/threonine-protein kinase